MNNLNLEFRVICVDRAGKQLDDIAALLNTYGLSLDQSVEIFVVAFQGKQIVACAGLDRNVIKCVAIDPQLRSENVSLPLISEVVQQAAERGYFHLFLYTKPENEQFFKGCGFYPLITVPGVLTFMENTPMGISRYCKELAKHKHIGQKIGGIVINANPFTLGHRYLLEQAASACDWLHVFVVREDLSMFSYADRIELVREGAAGIVNLTVHEGSAYMVSKATFPTYFIKEKKDVETASTACDLLLFRNYIAPALGITHRFVGTEPFCAVTKRYNEDMKYWLQEAPTNTPVVELVEIDRCAQSTGLVISASAVRAALAKQDFELIKTLVPNTTYEYLVKNYQDSNI